MHFGGRRVDFVTIDRNHPGAGVDQRIMSYPLAGVTLAFTIPPFRQTTSSRRQVLRSYGTS
jgi:hypothetical protein